MRQHGEHAVMRRLHDQMHLVSSKWIYGLLEKNKPLQITPLACSWSEDCGLLLEQTGFVKSLFPQSALLPTMPSFMQRAGRRWTWRQVWHAESQIKTDYFWDAETCYSFRRPSRDAALNDTQWAQRRSLCPNSAGTNSDFCMTSSRLKKSFVTEQEQLFTDSLSHLKITANIARAPYLLASLKCQHDALCLIHLPTHDKLHSGSTGSYSESCYGEKGKVNGAPLLHHGIQSFWGQSQSVWTTLTEQQEYSSGVSKLQPGGQLWPRHDLINNTLEVRRYS